MFGMGEELVGPAGGGQGASDSEKEPGAPGPGNAEGRMLGRGTAGPGQPGTPAREEKMASLRAEIVELERQIGEIDVEADAPDEPDTHDRPLTPPPQENRPELDAQTHAELFSDPDEEGATSPPQENRSELEDQVHAEPFSGPDEEGAAHSGSGAPQGPAPASQGDSDDEGEAGRRVLRVSPGGAGGALVPREEELGGWEDTTLGPVEREMLRLAEAHRRGEAEGRREAEERRKENLRKKEEAKVAAEAKRAARKEAQEQAKAEMRAQAEAEREARREQKAEATRKVKEEAEAKRKGKADAAAQAKDEAAVPLGPLTAAELLIGLAEEDAGPGESPDMRSYVWLMTLSALLEDVRPAAVAEASWPTGGDPLQDPSTMTREQVRDAVLDAVEHYGDPEQGRAARPRKIVLAVEKMVVFMEKHRDGRWHFHAAIRLSAQVSWLVLKLVLRRRARLASHWSTTHTQFWSTVRYGFFTSPTKPVVDAKPLPYTKDGTPLNLYEESQEPFCAGAWKRRREEKEQTSWNNKKACRFTIMDFTAVVLDKGLKTPAAVESYAQTKGSVGMKAYVRSNHKKLHGLIQECQEWDAAGAEFAEEEAMACSDWELVEKYAKAGPCACGEGGCAWRRAIDQFFEKNPKIDRERLAATLRGIIVSGPKKTTRVPFIVGPTSSGKSTYFNPVDEVFGSKRVIHRPPVTSPYGLMQLTRPGMLSISDL